MVPDKTEAGGCLHTTAVLADAVASGLDLTLVVISPDGAPVVSGTHVVEARCYELEAGNDGLVQEAKSKRLEVHLVTEKPRVPEVEEALIRLFDVARSDTGQSRIAADFLLAWWNAGQHGGFDIADLFSLDAAVSRDILTVTAHLSRSTVAVYADAFGHKGRMMQLIAQWRPDAMSAKDPAAR